MAKRTKSKTSIVKENVEVKEALSGILVEPEDKLDLSIPIHVNPLIPHACSKTVVLVKSDPVETSLLPNDSRFFVYTIPRSGKLCRPIYAIHEAVSQEKLLRASNDPDRKSRIVLPLWESDNSDVVWPILLSDVDYFYHLWVKHKVPASHLRFPKSGNEPTYLHTVLARMHSTIFSNSDGAGGDDAIDQFLLDEVLHPNFDGFVKDVVVCQVPVEWATRALFLRPMTEYMLYQFLSYNSINYIEIDL